VEFLLKPLVFVACIWFFLFYDSKNNTAQTRLGARGGMPVRSAWYSTFITVAVVLFNACFAFRTPFFLPAVACGIALCYATFRYHRTLVQAERQDNAALYGRLMRQRGLWTFTLLVIYLVAVLILR